MENAKKPAQGGNAQSEKSAAKVGVGPIKRKKRSKTAKLSKLAKLAKLPKPMDEQLQLFFLKNQLLPYVLSFLKHGRPNVKKRLGGDPPHYDFKEKEPQRKGKKNG